MTEDDKQPKPYSKFREKDDNDFNFNLKFNMRKSAPYLLVLLLFVITVLIVLVIFDKLLMPAMVHDRDTIKMPDITGLDLSKASVILEQSDLNYKVVNQQYSEQFPANVVLSQVPPPQQIIKEGRTVYLTISKGRETVTVPTLIGLNVRTARIELMKRGLELGAIAYDFSDMIAKDSIMYQSKNAGSSVQFGEVIDVVVSKGIATGTTVPSLIGSKLEDVEFILSQHGLILGVINYRHSETFTPNTVIEQSPSQGELVKDSTQINIIISK